MIASPMNMMINRFERDRGPRKSSSKLREMGMEFEQFRDFIPFEFIARQTDVLSVGKKNDR
jgi:hypothetical protein